MGKEALPRAGEHKYLCICSSLPAAATEDPNSLSDSIFLSSPGPVGARPAQPGAAALMEKLLVLVLQR